MTGTINCIWLPWFFVLTILAIIITCIWKRTLIEFIRCWMFARIDAMRAHFVNCSFSADDARTGRVSYSERLGRQNTDWDTRLKLSNIMSLDGEYRKIKQKIALARQDGLWFIDEAEHFKNEILRDILKTEGFTVRCTRTNVRISWKPEIMDEMSMFKRHF